MKMNIFHNNISKITVFRYPVETRHRFNVYKTSCVYRLKFPQIIEKNAISGYGCQPFKRQIKKMAKHTQTIRRQFADELFECVWSFCGIGAERVNENMLPI